MKVRIVLFSLFIAAVLSLPLPVSANSPRQDQPEGDEISGAIDKAIKQAGASVRSVRIPYSKRSLRGWDYLVQQLVAKEGLDPELVVSVFADKRMPARESLIFSVEPKESRTPYQRRLTSSELRNALNFYRENWFYFRQASMQYLIPEGVILAILQIETRCGNYVGSQRILWRLARLASAATPGNPLENFQRKRRSRSITLQQVVERARWLEETFLPHVAAVFRLAEHKNLHPLELRGSTAGALGLPQFLPGNYLEYGVDGNGDQRVDLFSAGDAIFSVGNFLRAHGWEGPNLEEEVQRKVIWHYNRSEPYINTVLKMSGQLEERIREIHEEIRQDILSEHVRTIAPISLSLPGRAAVVPRFIKH